MKALILAVTLVATGDITYMKVQPPANSPPTILTAPQKACLANWAKTVWPSIVPAATRELNCTRRPNGVKCIAIERRTVGKDLLVLADVDGSIIQNQLCTVIVDEEQATYCHRWGSSFLRPAEKTSLKVCLATVWPGVGVGSIRALEMTKDDGTVTARYYFETTGTQSEYLADRAAGNVVRAISVANEALEY